jgi:phthalate 4,5-dioxygenase oxygenase subunit
MDRHCPHRGADLCFGRAEDGGLRCVFHGWLFDVRGQCLEQPAEPEGSRSHLHLKHRAYPCVERNGIVFAYLGPGEPPPLPEADCLSAPSAYTFAFKGLVECNWLQVVEVGIDPAHASFLHRFLEDEDTADAYGKQFRAEVGGGMPLTRILREYPRPNIDVSETSYGLRILTTRDLTDTERHYRVTNLLFPNAIVIPMSREMTITQWHVPIDNHTCYWYALFTSFGEPVDQAAMLRQRLALYELPEYRPRLNRHNHYGFDVADQRSRTYTGMGPDINVHDQWAVESMGAIQDRTTEHLGKSDVAIVRYRKMLKAAMASMAGGGESRGDLRRVTGGDPEHAGSAGSGEAQSAAASREREPERIVAVDLIGPASDASCWRAFDEERRQRAAWKS